MQEQFVVLYLNRANKVIGFYQLSKGGITDIKISSVDYLDPAYTWISFAIIVIDVVQIMRTIIGVLLIDYAVSIN